MKILTSFLGVDKTVAQTQIVSEGFTVGTVTQSDSTDSAEGPNHNKVIIQSPVSSSLIDYDSPISITWRNFSFTPAPYSFTPGPYSFTPFAFTPYSFTPYSFTPYSFTPAPPVIVPDVVGMTPSEAQTALSAVGLTLGSSSSGTTTYYVELSGKVESQSPAAGTSVTLPQSVNLVYWNYSSTPPTGGTIPDVVGLHVNLALAVISEEGFQNAPLQGNSSVGATAANHQKVKSQNPAAGTTAPFYTNVQLVLYYYSADAYSFTPYSFTPYSFTPYSFTPYSFTPAATPTPSPTPYSFTPYSFTPYSFTPAGGGFTGCRGAKPYPYCVCQSDTPGTMWVC